MYIGRIPVLYNGGNKQRSILYRSRPAQLLHSISKSHDTVAHRRIVVIIHHAPTILCQPQLLLAFFRHRSKSFAMLIAHIGYHRNRRVNHHGKLLYLSSMRYARLNYRKVGAVVNIPQRQRHPYLGIIATRTSHYPVIVAQQLIKPFFHHGFSSATSYSQHRDMETVTMDRRKTLQSRYRVGHYNKIGICLGQTVRNMLHNEIAHSFFI